MMTGWGMLQTHFPAAVAVFSFGGDIATMGRASGMLACPFLCGVRQW